MRIALGSDHAGLPLKEFIGRLLQEDGHRVMDVGTNTSESVDYPDFAIEAAKLVSSGDAERGILVCGTGIGMCVTANKVKGIRAALAFESFVAAQSRKHVDANILVLGARITGPGLAEEIVRVWLNTSFEGGRHEKRVEKIREWELEHIR